MEIKKIDEEIVNQISTMAVAYSDVRLDQKDAQETLGVVNKRLYLILNDPEESNPDSPFLQAEVEDIAAMCLLWLQYNTENK